MSPPDAKAISEPFDETEGSANEGKALSAAAGPGLATTPGLLTASKPTSEPIRMKVATMQPGFPDPFIVVLSD
jgi:hypothetical protein